MNRFLLRENSKSLHAYNMTWPTPEWSEFSKIFPVRCNNDLNGYPSFPNRRRLVASTKVHFTKSGKDAIGLVCYLLHHGFNRVLMGFRGCHRVGSRENEGFSYVFAMKISLTVCVSIVKCTGRGYGGDVLVERRSLCREMFSAYLREFSKISPRQFFLAGPLGASPRPPASTPPPP